MLPPRAVAATSAAASTPALRRWSLTELRAARSSAPLVDTLRVRASRHSEALSRQRAALPADCTHLPHAFEKLSTCLNSFHSAPPHAALSSLDKSLRACVEMLRDAPEPERLHPATQLLLSSGFASIISARVLLWRIETCAAMYAMARLELAQSLGKRAAHHPFLAHRNVRCDACNGEPKARVGRSRKPPAHPFPCSPLPVPPFLLTDAFRAYPFPYPLSQSRMMHAMARLEHA
jgi:hypothetical protein